MEQGSWFVQNVVLVEPRGFRSEDQEDNCLSLFARKTPRREELTQKESTSGTVQVLCVKSSVLRCQ